MKIIKSSKYLYLLLLFVFYASSCKNKPKRIGKDNTFKVEAKDSIVLSVEMTGKGIFDLYYRDNYFNSISVNFINNEQKKRVINKSVPRFYNSFIFLYKVLVYNNGSFNNVEQRFFVDNDLDTLRLVYNANKYTFNRNLRDINQLYENYKKLNLEDSKSQEDYVISINKLDSVLAYNRTNFGDLDLEDLNNIYYFKNLQKFDGLNKKVDSFMKNIKSFTGSKAFSSLTYHYIKNRLQLFDYKKLNKNEYSEKYIELLAVGLFSFLRAQDNKGKKKHQPALNWLKTTNFYKEDSVFIKSKVSPLNNKKFISKLENLQLLSTNFKETTFAKIIQQHPSNYYLIDFWATWCAPCIGGIKKMQTMHIPNNVKIISLSVDKLSVQNKWKSTTKKLAQKITYLVNVKSQKSRDFLKFIELNAIPRYILIDKNMNLIDQAFLHPGEPQFLPKLQDVRNSKYW